MDEPRFELLYDMKVDLEPPQMIGQNSIDNIVENSARRLSSVIRPTSLYMATKANPCRSAPIINPPATGPIKSQNGTRTSGHKGAVAADIGIPGLNEKPSPLARFRANTW